MAGVFAVVLVAVAVAGVWAAARSRRRDLENRVIVELRIDDQGVGKTRADGYTESVHWDQISRIELVHRYGREAAPSLRDASLLTGRRGHRGPPGQVPSLLIVHGAGEQGCVLPATDETMGTFVDQLASSGLVPGFDSLRAIELQHDGSLGTHLLWARPDQPDRD